MPVLPNAADEKFCQLIMQCEIGGDSRPEYEAFISAYPSECEGKTEKAIKQSATKRLKHDLIASRLVQLRSLAGKKYGLTIEKLLQELDENRQIALHGNGQVKTRSVKDGDDFREEEIPHVPQASAANQSTMAKAKLAGLDQPDRIDVTSKGEKLEGNKTTVITPDMSETGASEAYLELVKSISGD